MSPCTWWTKGSTPGPIVLQEAIEIRDDDDWDSLEVRVHAARTPAAARAVRALLEGRLVVDGRRSRSREEDHERRAPIRRAMLASYDKTGIVEFATALAERDVRARSPRAAPPQRSAEAGLAVTKVDDVTGFPEMLGGRVKTLHPRSTPGCSPTGATPTMCARSRRTGSSRSTCWSAKLYPFRETVAAGAGSRT